MKIIFSHYPEFWIKYVFFPHMKMLLCELAHHVVKIRIHVCNTFLRVWSCCLNVPAGSWHPESASAILFCYILYIYSYIYFYSWLPHCLHSMLLLLSEILFYSSGCISSTHPSTWNSTVGKLYLTRPRPPLAPKRLNSLLCT